MAYTGRIDEQNPEQMFPAVYREPPPGPDVPQTSIPGMIFNAGQRFGASYTPPSQEYMARAMQGIAAQGGRPPVPAYLNEQPTTVAPVLPQLTPTQAPIPAFNPSSHEPSPPRNYIAEVNASQRGFNAERDTPVPPDFQSNYVPPMNAVRTNPWAPKAPAVSDPGLVYQELRQEGRTSGDPSFADAYEKKLLAQVHSMLPGASPKEVRSVMTTISQATRNPTSMNPTQPVQPGQAEPGSLSQAVAKVQQPAPTYQKLGAGQSIYQMNPDGSSKHVVTAPGGSAEQHKGDQFKELQKHSVSMYENTQKEYNKTWDQITKDITDPWQKDKALRELNTNHFTAMGIPEEIAKVPESFTLYAQDLLKPKPPVPGQPAPVNPPPPKTELTREEKDAAEKEHKRLMWVRNQLANRFYNNALQFGGPGGTR